MQVATNAPDVTTPTRRRLPIDRWGLLAIPPALFLLVFFVVPLLLIAVRSVTELPDGAGPLANFERFFASEANIRVLRNTFTIAAFSVIACVVIGYPYAYLMNKASGRVATVLLIAVLVPFWSSLLVRTYAWQAILRDTGIVNSVLMDWGLISEPVRIIGTVLGVAIGMTQVLLPFMVLPLYAFMRRIDPEYSKAAASLGANPLQSFLRVFLPLSFPGVIAGSLLVFVIALGFYITPALLGSPRETMLSQFIAIQIQERLDWGMGSAMAMVLVGLTLVALLVGSRVVKIGDAFGALDLE